MCVYTLDLSLQGKGKTLRYFAAPCGSFLSSHGAGPTLPHNFVRSIVPLGLITNWRSPAPTYSGRDGLRLSTYRTSVSSGTTVKMCEWKPETWPAPALNCVSKILLCNCRFSRIFAPSEETV